METIYYHVHTKRITCCAEEEQKVSGAPEGICCVVVPERKKKKVPSGESKIIDFTEYQKKLDPEEELECCDSDLETADVRERFGLAMDFFATAAIVAVMVLVVIRFWML